MDLLDGRGGLSPGRVDDEEMCANDGRKDSRRRRIRRENARGVCRRDKIAASESETGRQRDIRVARTQARENLRTAGTDSPRQGRIAGALIHSSETIDIIFAEHIRRTRHEAGMGGRISVAYAKYISSSRRFLKTHGHTTQAKAAISTANSRWGLSLETGDDAGGLSLEVAMKLGVCPQGGEGSVPSYHERASCSFCLPSRMAMRKMMHQMNPPAPDMEKIVNSAIFMMINDNSMAAVPQ